MERCLYVFEGCPYCRKVLDYMDKAGIEMEIKDAMDPGIMDELISVGGKFQAPCLVIDGKAMYESDDIIEYLNNK